MTTYVCPACGVRLVLSGPKTPAALARIIAAHEESDYHIAATGAAARVAGITRAED